MEVEAAPKNKRTITVTRPGQETEEIATAAQVEQPTAPVAKPVKHKHTQAATSQTHVTKKTTSTQAENIISDGLTESPDIDQAESKFDDFANAADKFDSDDTSSHPTKSSSLVQNVADDLITQDSDNQIANILKKSDAENLDSADDSKDPPIETEKEDKTSDPNFNKGNNKFGESDDTTAKLKKEYEASEKKEAANEKKNDNVVTASKEEPEKDADDQTIKDIDVCEEKVPTPVIALNQVEKPKKTKADAEAQEKNEDEETMQE